jgi:TldD protein
MESNKSIFFENYGVTTKDLESYLDAALERGGDYADIYFERKINYSIVLEEQIIKTATKAVNVGVGIRVLSGEKTGYAYSEDLDRKQILKAARTAAFIASSSSDGGRIGIEAPSVNENSLYSVQLLSTDIGIQQKIALLKEADPAARAFDPRISQVQASYIDETKHVLIVSSSGRCVWDVQPLVRMNVSCIAEENGKRQSGYQGGGGRRSLDIFSDDLNPGAIARESARQAVLQLNAIDAPAGPMEVVLGRLAGYSAA